MGAETPQERAQRDAERAEVAFWDYYHQGPSRSLAQLLRDYIEQAKENGPASVPTRHKPKLTEWRRLYQWDERCAELEAKSNQKAQLDYEAVRLARLDDLARLSSLAVHALEDLLKREQTQDPVRLRAVEAVLNRLGLTEKNANAQPAKAESPATINDGADQAEVLQHLKEIFSQA